FHDEVVKSEMLGMKDLAAAESEELACQGGGAVGDFTDLLAISPCGLTRVDLVDGEVGVALDDGEQVVEIVGDATSEASESVHFLRLAKIVFQLFALGFIPLERAAHAVEGAGNFAKFVAALERQLVGIIAVFESADTLDERAKWFCKCTGKEVNEKAAKKNGSKTEENEKEIQAANGCEGCIVRFEN